jgi:hypothetical protein
VTPGSSTHHSASPDPTPSAAATYYQVLGVDPTASPQDIRRAYRDLSKLYHPDTTTLSAAIATAKFQDLNEAYATLSSPDRRFAYDLQIGISRFSVIQTPPPLARTTYRSSAYLDPTDRPLSAGELFALLILTLTFVGCLLLAIAVGLTRGEITLQTPVPGILYPAPPSAHGAPPPF